MCAVIFRVRRSVSASDLNRRMTVSSRLIRGLCATTALSALLATAPVQFAPDFDLGAPVLKGKPAHARDGDDDGGRGGGRGGGDDNGGRGGGDDDGGRGRGGDDGGRGSDDDGGDDHGGHGRGSDDAGGDDHGGRSRGGDDPGGDDHRVRGSDDDDGNSGRGGGDDRADDRGAKVEIEGDKIEVTFADGTKQEIENGRFEQKDAAGRTIVERPAIRADFERLNAATTAGASIGTSVRSNGSKVEVSGRNIEVEHADGWKEEIEGGRYEMKDPNNNTVVERAATSDDRARLEDLAGF
jgi:hypothetical protein